ncbi:MAG: iron transporter [Treponema sp.]|jgi:uncharacterized protein involved in high-affinity Fe2+ transport|nr:iron transporter [Treponema sp.]
MKRKPVAFWGICLASFMAAFSCASIGGNEAVTVFLDEAIRASAEQLGSDLTGRKVAVVAFGSPSVALSEYVIDELSRALVNSRVVTVVDRKELDKVREELEFQLSGEVSDESARSIGKMLGADVVVLGSLADVGNAYRFGAKALDVESATIESAPAFDIARRDTRLVHLLNGAVVRRESAMVQQAGPQIVPKDPTEVFAAPGEAGFFEYPLGDDFMLGPLLVAGVFYQPVDIIPSSAGLPASQSDMHVEADISAAAGNYLGYGVGDFVPYLTVRYEIVRSRTGEKVAGTLIPMNASDGPHYGANIKLPGSGGLGTYTVRFIIQSPEAQGYVLHVDQETGVPGRFWSAPLVAEWSFDYAGPAW